MSPESVIVVAYFSASASGSLEEEGGDGGDPPHRHCVQAKTCLFVVTHAR